MKKLLHVIGARPNFVKAAPIIKQIKQDKILKQTVVHTGQHFDSDMSGSFLKQLNIGKPNHQLTLKSKTANSQICEISSKLEDIVKRCKPCAIVVYGDVNSSLAGAITAKNLNVKLVHVESGLRSFDKDMPEEKNRIVIDHLSDLHFVTEKSGIQNLLNENISKSSVHHVGNTMIDSLATFFEAEHDFTPPFVSASAHDPFIQHDPYCVATFHRPSNVDTKQGLTKILEILDWLSQEIKILLPLHPRTLNNLKKFKILNKIKQNENILITAPSSYETFLNFTKYANLVLTDSGGIQEETSYLNTPCLTLRKNTERPVTINRGSNVLVDSLDEVCSHYDAIKNGVFKKSKKIKFWDGAAAQRIAKVLYNEFA